MDLVLVTSGIALCMRLVRSELLSFPINTIAKVGERVEFECSTNLTTPLRWDFAEVNSTRFEFIYLNEEISKNFSSRYKVETPTNGTWTLVINSTDMSDAGTYRCLTTPNYHIGEKETSVSARLIVIDSDPICGTNASNGSVMELDSIEMWCTFYYSGDWLFVLECTRNIVQTDYAYIRYGSTYKSREVTSSFVTQLTSSDNGIIVACKMSLNSNASNNRTATEGETKATNIPHCQHLWNFSVNVLYGPRNPTIMLIDDELRVGSRLQCFADGNPAPSYEWELVEKNISLNNGSVLVIDEFMVSDEEQTLRCTAWNLVDTQVRKITATFTFNLTDKTPYLQRITNLPNGPSDLKLKPHLIIGINAGALILCLATLMIIYKIRRKGDVANTVSMPTNNCDRQQEIPLYTEVKKTINDKKKSGPNFTISEKEPKQNYTGADGTQYVELTSINNHKCNGVPVKQDPMFSMVETYASIDHTMAVPPPTPPAVSKRH